MRSRPTLEVFDLPKAFLKEIYGQDVESEPTSYRTKEIVVSMHEDIYATIDCLGICKFICHGFNSPKLLNYGHFSALLSKAYGLEITEEELRGVGRSTVDVERAFINREGVTGKDDTLPWRYFEEPMPHGVAKGHQIDRKEFAALLQRFYKLHGWTEDGLVTPQRVAELLAPWDEADGGVQ